jgi:hypothetical protein
MKTPSILTGRLFFPALGIGAAVIAEGGALQSFPCGIMSAAATRALPSAKGEISCYDER